MTNSNNSEVLARKAPKTIPGLYELTTFDDGTIVIKKKVSRDGLRIDEGKVKNGPVSTARLTD